MLQHLFNKKIALKGINYLIIGAVLFAVALLFCMIQEVNRDDETWFLQVVNRTCLGNVLYRDIFFGAGPLSVYFPALFCLSFGAELLIVRSFLALYFVSGILVSFAILKELNILKNFSLLFILSFFIFSHFQSTWGYSGYNNLAKVFFLLCFYFSLKQNNNSDSKNKVCQVISASFAALCFCTKQNIGIISLLILVLIPFFKMFKSLQSNKDALKEISIILLIFSLVTFFCFLPTILQGGLYDFIDYGLLNKTRYLKSQHLNYFLYLHRLDLYSIFIFISPFVLILAFFLAYPSMKKMKTIEPIIVLLFFCGAVLNLFPRPDNPQKMTYIPFVLLTLVYFSSKTSIFKQNQALQNLRFSFNLLAITVLSFSFLPLLKGTNVICKLPHFHGIIMDKSQEIHWKSLKKSFLKKGHEKNIFFLSTHAGFYYLLFNIPNPTSHDLPIHPALGTTGEEKILKDLQADIINEIYIDNTNWSNWFTMPLDRHPRKIEHYMTDHMQEKRFLYSDFLGTCFQVFTNKTQ